MHSAVRQAAAMFDLHAMCTDCEAAPKSELLSPFNCEKKMITRAVEMTPGIYA